MSIEETWRPLGVDDDDQIAEYDALHDGVSAWMAAAFWAWIRQALTETRRYPDGSGRMPHLREGLTEEMAQALRIPFPNLRVASPDRVKGAKQLGAALEVLQKHSDPLQIADYILAFFPDAHPDALDDLLERSKSAWRVGRRAAKPGLVRRVPLGVQVGADFVMARAGRAGLRLASAWEVLYSPVPNASEAYRLAILAVEDASIPIVSPTNQSATLGTVLRQMEDQGDWILPMTREHPRAPTRDVIVAMMRMLWHGQHDRHGGQPSAPGDVSQDEAIVAIGIATTVVHWFSAGLINRADA
ncbi:hypothetical protein AB0C34_28120 [Nocardia sp. NPDC049220]|uniref:hypothetical protein n=1 Tax=Nocardia sp. NPDC049220 TaxID=3155273 RepID=UPI0033DD26F3